MPFTTQDQITAALPGQVTSYIKTAAAAPVAGAFQSLWDSTGNPAAGVLAVGNTTTGTVPTQATAGAWAKFTNPGTTLHNGRFTATTSQAGTLMLYDRVWHAGSFALSAAGNFAGWSGTTAVNRPSTGDGVMAWVEVNVVLAATATTITITFTNQAALTGQTATCALLASSAARRMYPFVMPAGSTGIRSIQTINIGTAVATGSINIVLAAPVISAPVLVAGGGVVYDYLQTGNKQIQNDACLAGMWISNTATAPVLTGDINLITSP